MAFEQAAYEKAMRIARNLIKRGKMTIEETAEVCELPIEMVKELASSTAPSTEGSSSDSEGCL